MELLTVQRQKIDQRKRLPQEPTELLWLSAPQAEAQGTWWNATVTGYLR